VTGVRGRCFPAIALLGTVTLAGTAAGPVAAQPSPLDAGASVCPGAVGQSGDVAVVNLTPVHATASGFGALRSSGAPSNNSLGADAVSNVNFGVDSVDPNVAFAAIGPDGRLCFDNSPHATVDLVADQMGVLPAAAYRPAGVTGAERIVDTRRGFVAGGPRAGRVAPGGSVCPRAAGTPGQIAVLNVTPIEASGDGFAAVRASDAPSNNSLGDAAVSNVNFTIGSVDPNLSFAEIGGDGRVCVDNSPNAAVHLVVDQMGALATGAFVPAAASGAKRLVDTRRGLVMGGSATGPIPPGGVVCAVAVGDPGDIAVVNGTPVAASGPGFMAVRSSNAPSNNTLGESAVSNWNFAVGTVDPNVAIATIGPDGRICVDNSPHATVEMVLDQAGSIQSGQFRPAAATGATRIVDTRRGFVAAPTTAPEGEVTTPSAPRAVTATAAPGAVALAWTEPAYDGGATIEQYQVERATASSGPWTLVTLTTATSHHDTGTVLGIDYWYRVSARNAAGWGTTSAPVEGRSDPPTPPAAVRQLSGTSQSHSVTVSWLPPLDDGGAPVTGYSVRHELNCNSANSTSVGPVSATAYVHAALSTGARYCYRVAAVNAAGTGPNTTITMMVGRPTAPAPCSIHASWFPVQDGSVEWSLDVTWSTPTDDGGSPITGYAVAWYDAVTTATVGTELLASSARSAFLDQVDGGRTYQAFVRATNASGLGVECITAIVSTA
jgi:hypothetical protein